MKPDAMQLLAIVQKFLLDDVLDAVPSGLRSEVRAAAKCLANAQGELNGLYPLLLREHSVLAGLCREAEALLGGAGTNSGAGSEEMPASLADLTAEHRALQDRLGTLTLALQESMGAGAGEMLARIYRTLGDQAQARLAFQSVFPPAPLPSEILRDSWTGGE